MGKSDALDAHQIAMSTLPLTVAKLRRPRLHDGVRQGVRILVTARQSMAKDRTRAINALNALVRSNDLGIDARRKLTSTQITDRGYLARSRASMPFLPGVYGQTA